MRRQLSALGVFLAGLALGWAAPRSAAPQVPDPLAYYAGRYIREPTSFSLTYQYAYALMQTLQDTAIGPGGPIAMHDSPGWETLHELLQRCDDLATTPTEQNLSRVLRSATAELARQLGLSPTP